MKQTNDLHLVESNVIPSSKQEQVVSNILEFSSENNIKPGTLTWIPLSKSRFMYESKGLKFPYLQDEDARESFCMRCKNNYRRVVNQIFVLQRLDESLYLDWTEERFSKTSMGSELSCTVQHVPTYLNPTPDYKLEFNPETEEHYMKQLEIEKSHETEWQVLFSKDALQELLKDTIRTQTAYFIQREKGKTYSVTLDELLNMKDFNTLFEEKTPKVVK